MSTACARREEGLTESEMRAYESALVQTKRLGAAVRDVANVADLPHPDAPKTLHETREEWKARGAGR